jgi:hypothetical protein
MRYYTPGPKNLCRFVSRLDNIASFDRVKFDHIKFINDHSRAVVFTVDGTLVVSVYVLTLALRVKA